MDIHILLIHCFNVLLIYWKVSLIIKGEDCLKKFCKDIKEYATQIINYEKKELISLTYEESKSYEKQNVCYMCKKEFQTDTNDKNAFKLYHKVRDHYHFNGKYRGAAHNICILRYKLPR